MLNKQVVGRTEVGQAGVRLDRQHQIPMRDLGGTVQAPQDFLVRGEFRLRQERVGDLSLAVPVRWQCALHACNHAGQRLFARHFINYAPTRAGAAITGR